MSRPKVTLLTQIFPPESNAGANRAGAAARALAVRADLRVVTILPSYPSPEHHVEHDTLRGHDEALNFAVDRAGAFHPHRGSYVVRAGREAAMAARMAWKAARRRPDLFVATSPSIFVGLSGSVASLVTRRPLVIDLRDLTWEYLADDSRERSFAMRFLAKVLERLAVIGLKRASVVSVSNAGIRRAVEELGVSPQRVLDAPNGVSAAILARASALPDPAAQPEPFVVTYAGALGYYQGVATLVEVAARLPDVEFRVIGDGPERVNIEKKVWQAGIDNLVLTGYLSRDEVFDHYGRSDILFAQLRDLPVLAAATFPSKPFELMATGRPLVYAGTGITADFLEQTGAALIAAPEDPDSISTAIRRLVDDAGLRRELGRAGRSAAPDYQRETIMDEWAAAVLAEATQP